MKNSYPTWLKELKLIAWDLDGTLYASNSALWGYIEKQRVALIAQHLKLSEAEAEQKFQDIYQQLHSHTRTLDALGLNGHDFFIDMWQKINLRHFVKPDPELNNLFKKVRQTTDFKHVILTNANTQESAIKKLNEIGLSVEFFDKIFTPIVTGHSKPQPEAFEPLWQETGVDREQIVYIGDKENTDILPARSLGLRTILINSGQQVESAADWQIASPSELLEVLLKNFSN